MNPETPIQITDFVPLCKLTATEGRLFRFRVPFNGNPTFIQLQGYCYNPSKNQSPSPA